MQRNDSGPTRAVEPSGATPATKLRMLPDAAAYGFLLIVMLTWAGNSVVGRAVRAEVPPFDLALVRWSGALILMAPFAVGSVRRDRTVLRSHWPITVLLGFLGVACFNAFLYLGVHYTTASNAILLQAATPAIILLCTRLLFGERAGVAQVVGVILSTAGVALVVSKADVRFLLQLRFSVGDICVLCGVVCWSLYTSLLRLRPRLDPRSFLVATFAVGVIVMAPLAAGEWAAGEVIHWKPATVAAMAYVAVFPSLVGYLLYNLSVGMIGAARAGQTITLMPVFGAFLAAGLLGEPLHAYHLVAMGLIAAGIALSALRLRAAR